MRLANKKRLGLFGFVFAAGVAFIFAMTQGNDYPTPDREAKAAVEHMLTAAKAGKWEEAAQYSRDLRFPTEAQMAEHLKAEAAGNAVLSATVVDTQALDDTKVNVKVNLKTKEEGEMELTFPVRKEGGRWVVITGQDIPHEEAAN